MSSAGRADGARTERVIVMVWDGMRPDFVTEELTRPEYWGRQLREGVRFAGGVAALKREGFRVCLELGPGGELSALALGAIGVVYGDIGTSPLYAIRECLVHVGQGEEHVLGVVSLVFWSLIFVVVLKYLTLVLRADNHGEGGVLALKAEAPLKTDVDRLFNWAESVYVELFPHHVASSWLKGYYARCYQTGLCVGESGGKVYLYNGTIREVGGVMEMLNSRALPAGF